MKAAFGFIFFLLFLAGLAFTNLSTMENRRGKPVLSSTTLFGTQWRLTHLGEMRLPPDTPMELQFDQESGVSGHAGCNDFFGSFSIEESVLDIGPLASTRKHCPEPENSYEQTYLAGLEATHSAVLAGSHLVFKDKDEVIACRFIAVAAESTE